MSLLEILENGQRLLESCNLSGGKAASLRASLPLPTRMSFNFVTYSTTEDSGFRVRDSLLIDGTVLRSLCTGRQKELNSLKEMGVMTAVKRTTAADKRVIQTRWVDREKDGCVKSR